MRRLRLRGRASSSPRFSEHPSGLTSSVLFNNKCRWTVANHIPSAKKQVKYCFPTFSWIADDPAVETWLEIEPSIECNVLALFFQVIKLVPNHGVLDVPWLVFLVFVVVVLTVPARVLTETCVVVDVCSPPLRSGAVGIARSMWTRNATLYAQRSQHPEFRHWLCPKVRWALNLVKIYPSMMTICFPCFWS